MIARVLVLACVVACGGGGGSPAHSGDAGPISDGNPDGPPGGSRCSLGGTTLTCTHETLQLGGRTVTYQVPLGAPPPSGWPSVIYYQGSIVAGSNAFAATMGATFGQYELTSTVAALLERGFAVIAPDATGGYWQTNIPPASTSWTGCADDMFVVQLIEATADGTFGPLDPGRRYAMGISSGGFMTSRMAVSYAGTFRALAIASASYATCSVTCAVPDLPADHPPTLFLHGDADPIVPVATMVTYRDKLVAGGFAVDSIVDTGAGHAWLPEGKTAIPAWFEAH